MTKTKKKVPVEAPRFPTWPNGKCGHCGHQADPNSTEPYLYELACPECSRDGCDECMPLGRGCRCPDCENAR